ncbi:MAG: hypothetical protein JST49_06580 [Bacteroidetes bacterium]|nr:hypothetical protein [Bacteroidota bacterium]
MPKGRYLPLGDYYPLMYTLPPLYNVSPAGPMPPINNLRKAETKQLKAYLLVYEQVYANWNVQIEKLNQFFSTSKASLSNTYATKLIDNGDLLDVQDVYASGFTESFLNEIGESLRELYDRKNRTYNHLLARLGENNNDYLLLNNQLDGKLIDPENVIDNKRELIKSFSQNTYNKARSLNYMADSNFWSSTVNMGLIGKLNSLLGLQSVMDALTWQYVPNSGLGNYQLTANYSAQIFEMNIWLTVEQAPHPFITEVYVAQVANDLSNLFNSNSGVTYSTEITGQQFRIVAFEPDGTLLWKLAEFFPTSELEDEQGEYDEDKAENFINGILAERRDAVLEFSTRNTIIPIENLLLRPRTNGEDVFNICVPNDCEFCGDEDPYSFRMTFILCGDDGYWGSNLAYRAYAENVIRKEVPAHIVSRICWLSKTEFTNVFTLFQNWLRNEVAHESDYVDVVNARKLLVAKLNNMRSMYPEATLHDCEDGNDNNRVFLGKTVISI